MQREYTYRERERILFLLFLSLFYSLLFPLLPCELAFYWFQFVSSSTRWKSFFPLLTWTLSSVNLQLTSTQTKLTNHTHKSAERRKKCVTSEAQFALFVPSRYIHLHWCQWNFPFSIVSIVTQYVTHTCDTSWRLFKRKGEKEEVKTTKGKGRSKTWQMLHFATKCPLVIAFSPISVWTFDGSGVWSAHFFCYSRKEGHTNREAMWL